jgi:hypothetical protein
MAELRLMNPSIYACEDEVDKWREKAYAGTDKMSIHEFTEFINRKTESVMEEFHLKSTEKPLQVKTGVTQER